MAQLRSRIFAACLKHFKHIETLSTRNATAAPKGTTTTYDQRITITHGHNLWHGLTAHICCTNSSTVSTAHVWHHIKVEALENIEHMNTDKNIRAQPNPTAASLHRAYKL